jgi:hypothetical protein
MSGFKARMRAAALPAPKNETALLLAELTRVRNQRDVLATEARVTKGERDQARGQARSAAAMLAAAERQCAAGCEHAAAVAARDESLAAERFQVRFLREQLVAVVVKLDTETARADGLASELAAAENARQQAENHVVGQCDHAKANVELVHTLHAQERVIAELQAINEGYESGGFARRVTAVAVVPKQRRPK